MREGVIVKDCVDGMRDLPDCSISLTLTSPPYDSMKTYDNYATWNWDVFTKVAKQLYRVTKNGGVVVWVVSDSTKDGDESGTSFKQALYFKEIGFKLLDTMIWYKSNAYNFGSNNCYPQSFEYMFILTKGKIGTHNILKDVPTKCTGKVATKVRRHENGVEDRDGTRYLIPEFRKRRNVWDILVGQEKSIGHPAVFPEKLAEGHILSWSNEGDWVMDPFSGSGTVWKMAKINNRRFIGFEINPEYAERSQSRIDSLFQKDSEL